MERLKDMKETLITCVENQLYSNYQNVDTKELGEAVDMIKDLSEAIYYCTIAKEMEDCKEQEKMMKHMHQYKMMPRYEEEPISLDYKEKESNRRYYDGRGDSTSYNMGRGSDGRRYYGHDIYPSSMDEYNYPTEIRDFREGRSPMTRRNYMESKELHQGKEKQMKELEKYIMELGQDLTEMIKDAEPDEKAMLSQKLSILVDKLDK